MTDVAVRILLPEMVGKVGIDNQAKAFAYDGKTGLPQPVQVESGFGSGPILCKRSRKSVGGEYHHFKISARREI
jgi:hypothetical protein